MPPKIAPIDWETLVRVFEADGFTYSRTKGSHIILEKPGVARPIVIPKYTEITNYIILSNMRTARMSRARYLKLLDQV